MLISYCFEKKLILQNRVSHLSTEYLKKYLKNKKSTKTIDTPKHGNDLKTEKWDTDANETWTDYADNI